MVVAFMMFIKKRQENLRKRPSAVDFSLLFLAELDIFVSLETNLFFFQKKFTLTFALNTCDCFFLYFWDEQ